MRSPDAVPNLASSERSPFQAFRLPDRPIWASQFHPELQRETNTHRLLHYQEVYAPLLDEKQKAETLSRFTDSPQASDLLRRFLDLVFG